MSTLLELVERRLEVVQALAANQCGGSYGDACILISSLISGMAAHLWPGRYIDQKRFVEIWARYADPGQLANSVSVPLLTQSLRAKERIAEAGMLEARQDQMFGPGYSVRVLSGVEVDLAESDVLQTCPGLALRDVRRYSYGAVFYEDVRSALVHEYQLTNQASAWPMTRKEAGISYVNYGSGDDASDMERRIHYHIPWLLGLVRSIARSVEPVWATGPIARPARWWVSGG